MAVMHYYDGTAWKNPYFLYPKMWDGANWVYVRPYYYNGLNWLGFASLDIQTVTIGTATGGGKAGIIFRGFVSGAAPILTSTSFGSINTGNSAIYSAAPVYQLYSSDAGSFTLRIGGNQANSGWNTLSFGSTPGSFTLARTNATYTAGSSTSWVWNTADPYAAYADGVSVPVIFG